jgi:hypothetical protein
MLRVNLNLALLLALLFTATPALAQSCPGENDEPAISVKTEAGPTLIVCGFEDHEVKAGKDKRAFTDFSIYSAVGEKTPQKVFSGESSETYWIQSLTKKGLQLEELWFFSDDPKPAIQRQITCTAEACAVGEPKCIFKMKRNPFPKALAEFKKKASAGKLGEDGEELLDQIFAQAITGDKAAKEFYSKDPGQLDSAMTEVFKGNQEKLKLSCKP